DDIVVRVRSVHKNQPCPAVMGRPVEGGGVAISLRNARRRGREFGPGLREVPARARLVNISTLARRQVEFRGRVWRQIQCENKELCRSIDREIERRPPVEGADFDDLRAARHRGGCARQYGKLGEIDVARMLPRFDDGNRLSRQNRLPWHDRQPRRLPARHAAHAPAQCAEILRQRRERKINRARENAVEAAFQRDAKAAHDRRGKAYSFSTCPNSSSTGVARPKIETATFTRERPSSTSSTVPLNDANGPSDTRTCSPTSNVIEGFGRSMPSCTWLRMRWASASEIGIGFLSAPRKPVTLGVFLIR